jgi:glucose/arabinose dehydrogenase
MSLRAAAISTAVLFALPSLAFAQGFPNPSLYRIERIVTGLSTPLFVTAPTGDSRLFIMERGGRIKVRENGVVSPTNVIDISANVATSGERGLLGMAFAPDFATSRRFYTYYIDNTTFNTRIDRFELPVGSNVAINRTNVYTVTQHPRDNHKGGWIGFRPGEANNLYIAMGDSGGGNDPDNAAQNLNSPLGKILRIDVSGTGVAVPASGNPFSATSSPAGRTDIYAYGVRNPYRSSFDRQTGHFYIGDVGQDTREEVNVDEGTFDGLGKNYGWRPLEGNGDNPGVGDAAPANATPPAFSYRHGIDSPSESGFRGSVTGGFVYRGTDIPTLNGQYVFGDYVTGRIGMFRYDPATNLATNYFDLTGMLNPGFANIGRFDLASFGEDGRGELYLVDIDGDIYQLRARSVIPEPTSLALVASAMPLLLRRR